MPERPFVPEDLARFRAMVPERKRGPRMTDAEARRALLALATRAEAAAVPYRKTGADQDQAAYWEERAARVRAVAGKESLTDLETKELREELSVAVGAVRERLDRGSPSPKETRELQARMEELTRLREWLDARFTEAA